MIAYDAYYDYFYDIFLPFKNIIFRVLQYFVLSLLVIIF